MSKDVINSYRIIDNDDIQLLRYWRNDEKIMEMMINHSLISREDQRKWFASLDSKKSMHYIYAFGSEDVGSFSINIKNVEDGIFEAGLLCGNKKYNGHWINIWATLAIYDLAFDMHGMRVAIARILDENKKAIILNKKIGYKYIGKVSDNIGLYHLDRSDYDISSPSIKKIICGYVR